jgi:ribonuclease P protein component
VLTKTERIKYSGLFQQAFQKGKTIRSKNLRLSFTTTLPQYKDKLPLVGIVVSKGFSKKAVERNKIKRRLREVYRKFRLNHNNANKLNNIGLLVVAIKPEAGMLEYAELREELQFLLSKSLGFK